VPPTPALTSRCRARPRTRPFVGTEGFSDGRMEALASPFVIHHVGEGGGQLANRALAEGPFGLDPGEGLRPEGPCDREVVERHDA